MAQGLNEQSILSLLMADHSKRSPSQIRIVAGRWRGRKLSVVRADGLRPTGDRVRETLFNWLQMQVPGTRCLDLFAGTGALGLEAASRGAASVTLVEESAPVAAQLQVTLTELDAGTEVALFSQSAEQFLATRPDPFDLVFIDPPFDQQLHAVIVDQLVPTFLNHGALVYVELPTPEAGIVDKLPASLTKWKEKRFGDVTVFLLRYESPV